MMNIAPVMFLEMIEDGVINTCLKFPIVVWMKENAVRRRNKNQYTRKRKVRMPTVDGLYDIKSFEYSGSTTMNNDYLCSSLIMENSNHLYSM